MKTGRKEKDAAISDNFNPLKQGMSAVRELQKQIRELKSAVKEKTEALASSKVVVPEESSAMQMLNDLRYAYKNSVGNDGKKGRQRLMELMKNDADFKFAMKELMKIESSIASAQVKSKELGNGNMTTFVVLKGLHSDPSMDIKKVNGVIDFAQVSDAFSPTTEKKIAYEEEMVRPEGG
jgi:hypothetical protein